MYNAEDYQRPKTKKRKLVKWFIFICLVAAIIAAVLWFLSRLNRPVTSIVNTSQGQINQNYYNIDLTPVNQTGPYASFDHPKGVPLTSSSLISAISVEDFTYYVKDVYSWTLAIDIIRNPSGKLSESSSYNLRKKNPSTYSETLTTINGQQVSIMTDTTFPQGFSKVAYMTHQNYVGIISLVGNDTKGLPPLQTSFDMVLTSWKWLQ